MLRYVESQDRQQVTLLPECLDDFMGEDKPLRLPTYGSRPCNKVLVTPRSKSDADGCGHRESQTHARSPT